MGDCSQLWPWTRNWRGVTRPFSCQSREKSAVTLAMMDRLGGRNVRPSQCCNITLVSTHISLTHSFSNRCPGTTTSPWLNFCRPGSSGWLGYELQDRGNVVRLPIRTKHSLKLNNCPKRCDLFGLLYFCRQLYVFQVLTPIIRSSHNCNYSFWYWLTAMNKIRCY